MSNNNNNQNIKHTGNIADVVVKSLSEFVGRNYGYAHTIDTDATIIRDEFGDIAEVKPYLHVKFRDGSELKQELGPIANVAGIHLVTHPMPDDVFRKLAGLGHKFKSYLKSVDTDTRVIRDEFEDIEALIPRIHLVFKDTSDFVDEITGVTNVLS